MPISAEVPPTSKVISRSRPDNAPPQGPPGTPAAGPESSVSTGVFATVAGVATPPLEHITCRSAAKPSWLKLLASRRTQARPDEGVEQSRGKALELAELRRHLGRGADEAIGELLARDVARPLLMRC